MDPYKSHLCSKCRNVLTPVTLSSLVFKCKSCGNEDKAADSDTLRYEEKKGDNISILMHAVHDVQYDHAAPKMRKECPKCHYPIARYVVLGNDMVRAYTCTSCFHKFL